MSRGSSWLVLFDIDGTLVQTGRAGVRGMNAAFHRLYGAENALDGTPIAGRTDRGIVTDVLTRLRRMPDDEAIEALRAAYLEHLPDELERPVAAPKCVLPGVHALLDELAGRDDVRIGLLTGNFEGGARIKLGYFDLWTRFAFGAFGDAHCDRRALVPLAVGRAGVSVDAARVVVIGDTPLDVDCARAHGARAVGVATGPYAVDDLRGEGADVVVQTLDELSVERLLPTG
jgi:phosphoglycolate phosphatase-like HAD superfamily hydrolase